MATFPTKQDQELVRAISNLKDEKEIVGFLRDLLTPSEIQEFSRRFHIAKLLWTTNSSYIEIARKVNTSTTTVTRVAQWLYKESWRGYRSVLQRMYGDSQR
jgi:TrpR-related protein YerC/YecD